ncbi:MAG: polymerase sigma factor, sigma-70 family [Chthonomonadaceae bacterium]|nr:polymerase sigma factor, sigma-70 family [Chthonomonadaceae bacterium]
MPIARIETHQETPYEKRLVARLQAGEAEALGVLFELHVDRVFAFARHLLGSREDAEEIVTEAFLRAFQRATDYRGECPFRGWLFGITRNLCIDRLRQPRLLLLEPEAFERHTDHGQAAEQMETNMVVRQALAQLSEEHRLVLTLCDVEEWDAHEVAAILEKSLPATKSLLYRARRALRTQLTALWEEEEEAHDAL